MAIGWQHVIGIALVLILIAGVGLLSGRRVKNAADFTTGGGKAGALMVCGTILGSLLSGQATVGTAQMAYTYGLSAWWFTLGAGLGCLVLAVGYAVPLRRGGQCTLLQVVSEKYGARAGTLGSILCSLGIFISVVSQVLAACALLTTIFPMNTGEAVLLSLALMTVYVVFGGAWGAGMGGIVKMVLLYAAGMLGLILVLSQGGVGALLDHVKAVVLDAGVGAGSGITNEGAFWHRFTHLFARGVLQDAGFRSVAAVGGTIHTDLRPSDLVRPQRQRRPEGGAAQRLSNAGGGPCLHRDRAFHAGAFDHGGGSSGADSGGTVGA